MPLNECPIVMQKLQHRRLRKLCRRHGRVRYSRNTGDCGGACKKRENRVCVLKLSEQAHRMRCHSLLGQHTERLETARPSTMAPLVMTRRMCVI